MTKTDRMKRLPALAAALICLSTMAQEKTTLRQDNIDEVISCLTLKEKASLVVGAGYKSMLAGVFGFKAPVPGAAGMTRAVPRLGIPAIVLSDGPAGVRIDPKRNGFCTGFPIGSLLSSTWNLELVEKVSGQHLDATEDIDVYPLDPDYVRELLLENQILQALMAAPLWKYFYGKDR